jgi:hypothetical protein
MLKESKGRKVIKDPEMEGEVRTSFVRKFLVSLSGVEFHATVETSFGTGHVKYLVNPIDAARRNELEWMPFFSVEDLMEEAPSTPSRWNPTSN